MARFTFDKISVEIVLEKGTDLSEQQVTDLLEIIGSETRTAQTRIQARLDASFPELKAQVGLYS